MKTCPVCGSGENEAHQYPPAYWCGTHTRNGSTIGSTACHEINKLKKINKDLYGALKELLGSLSHTVLCPEDALSDEWEAAEDAIAKAEGRE